MTWKRALLGVHHLDDLSDQWTTPRERAVDPELIE
jgi:hypothetical protein